MREKIMQYLSIRQIAEKWRLSARRINALCAEGRIGGTSKIDSYWAVLATAEKPKDGKIKSRKYIKNTQGRKGSWIVSLLHN